MEAVKVASLGQISGGAVRASAASTGATCSGLMSATASQRSDLTDAVGTVHQPAGADARIVCLVPSITELVCDLGLAAPARRPDRVLHPSRGRRCAESRRSAAPRTSSSTGSASSHRRTRSSTSTRTAARPPTSWREFVPHVVVTHPRSPLDNLAAVPAARRDLRPRNPRRSVLCGEVRGGARAPARLAERPRDDVLYLIWRDPWMAVSPDTYISRTLALVNWRDAPV